MSDRITFSAPYCFLERSKNCVGFAELFTVFKCRIRVNPTSASVQVPHLTARVHLNKERTSSPTRTERNHNVMLHHIQENKALFVGKLYSRTKSEPQAIILLPFMSLAPSVHPIVVTQSEVLL